MGGVLAPAQEVHLILLKSVVRFCGPKAGAWLLSGATLIRSSTLPEFHSLLGFFS